jgi:protein disulfide-isomerase A6
MHYSTSFVAATALLAPLASAAGLYPKSSAVLNVDGKNFDKLIKNSDKAAVRNDLPDTKGL